MTTTVYFSNAYIRVMSASADKKGITVSKFASLPVEHGALINGAITNENEIKLMLARLWQENDFPTNNIDIVIDSSSIMTKRLVVPKTNDANILSIVSKEFGEVESNSELIFDYFVLTPSLKEGGAEIIACAAERGFISGYIELFSALGEKVKISSIDYVLDCGIKFWQFVSEFKEKTAIVAVLDGNILSLTLFVNGRYRFNNRTRLIDERGFPGSVDEIAGLLSSMIQFNRSERSGFDISDIYFCGLTEDEDDLCRNIGNVLEVSNINPFPEFRSLISPSKKCRLDGFSVSDYIYCLGNTIKL